MAIWVDMTDLVHFAQGHDPVSGVQRVVAEVGCLLAGAEPVIVDRDRGVWVQLPEAVRVISKGLRGQGDLDRDQVSLAADQAISEIPSREPVDMGSDDVLVVLGSSWIDQTNLLAVQRAQDRGARVVAFLHDLTPVREAGHAPEVTLAFHRYLRTLASGQTIVVANSTATRTDFEDYCSSHGLTPPPCVVSGLPPGLLPSQLASDAADSHKPWPRPFVLFVGTIEARKGHLTALRAWRQLRAERGEEIPDLVCVGRWGWGSQEFRDEWDRARNSGSGVHVLTGGVTDAELVHMYSQCLATVYPSRMEGWGLPVSESLAFGKVPVTTNVSSLPEAGAGLAVTVPPDDPQALAEAVATTILDDKARTELEERIRQAPAHLNPLTWQHVAETVDTAIGQARAMSDGSDWSVQPRPLPLRREFILGIAAEVADPSSVRVEALAADRGSPLLGQPVDSEDVLIVDDLVHGDFAKPTTWGYPVHVGGSVDIRFTTNENSESVLLVATAPVVGSGTVDISVNKGPLTRQPLAYGEVLTIPIPAPTSNPEVAVHVDVIAQDKADGLPLTLQSLVLLDADDPRARISVLERIARARSVQLTEAEHQVNALGEQLQGVLTSRSWKLTKPLRKVTGDER